MKFLHKVKNFFIALVSRSSEISSKRFIALFVGTVLISYIVVRFTDKENFTAVLAQLIGFSIGLLFGGVYEKIKK
mgnify:CR=1 FL=1